MEIRVYINLEEDLMAEKRGIQPIRCKVNFNRKESDLFRIISSCFSNFNASVLGGFLFYKIFRVSSLNGHGCLVYCGIFPYGFNMKTSTLG
jgi:hypothetical protein